MGEGVRDRTELQYIDPHSYGHQRCLFLVLLMLNRRPGGSAFCWLSLPHLITNWSGPQTPSGIPGAPSAGWWLSLPHLSSNSSDLQLVWSPTRLISNTSDLQLNQGPHRPPPPPARISLILSCHFSLSFITFGRSSGLHPVACLVVAHIFSFVFIDMEANACGRSFQTMH